MTGTGEGKGAKYNRSDFLILETSLEWITILLKVRTVITVFRLRRQAQLPTSILPADIPSPSSVRDEKRNIYNGLRHTMHLTH